MGMDIDQSRQDQLAARINDLDSGALDVGLNRRYTTIDNRKIPRSVNPPRRINHAATLDNQIVFSRLRRECPCRSGSRFHDRACVQELTPVHNETLYSRSPEVRT